MGADARVDVLLALKAQLTGFDGAATAVPNLSRAVTKAGSDIKEQTRTIGDDVDALGKKITKEFSMEKLAKGLLGGAGVAGGIGLVTLTIEKWVAVWKDSADYAKDLQDRSEKIAEAMQATAKAAREAYLAGLSPEAALAARKQEAAAATARMSAAEARRSGSLGAIGWLEANAGQNPLGISNIGARVNSYGGESFGDTGIGGRDFVQLMQARADEAQVAWNKAREELIKVKADIAKLDKEIADAKKKSVDDAWEEEVKRGSDLVRLAGKGVDYKSMKELTPEQEVAAADAARKALADMQQDEMNAAIERARLASLSAGPNHKMLDYPSADELVEAADAAKKAIGEVSAEGKKFNAEMAQLWNNVSDRAGQAFADILLDGTNTFRDLAKEIARSILEIVARMAIINPLLNSLFGSFGGFQKLPTFSTAAAAGGGSFLTSGPTNFTVGDNPGGVELVSVLPLSGVGRSSINGRSLAMAGGGSAMVGGGGFGDTFNFAYTFAGGVSREEIMGLLPTIVEASKGAVLDAQRRRRDGFGR